MQMNEAQDEIIERPFSFPTAWEGPRAAQFFIDWPFELDALLHQIDTRFRAKKFGCFHDNVRRLVAMALAYLEQIELSLTLDQMERYQEVRG